MSEPIFYPNDLSPDQVDDLEPWQLLVAAGHFGETMGDCVELNYGYSRKGGEIFCHDGKDEISLKGDIDLGDPLYALQQYADFSWYDYARDKIRGALDA